VAVEGSKVPLAHCDFNKMSVFRLYKVMQP
jgi:hypothetical protein